MTTTSEATQAINGQSYSVIYFDLERNEAGGPPESLKSGKPQILRKDSLDNGKRK